MKFCTNNMVCYRCKTLINTGVEAPGLVYKIEESDDMKTEENISNEKHDLLNEVMKESGVGFFVDRKINLVEKIKNEIVKMIYFSDGLPRIKNSVYLSNKLNHSYSYLSNIFSEIEGTTIEHFIIATKIERVKDLLVHDKLYLNEIAFELNYSSVAHLSYQFKKVTGLTPSLYRQSSSQKNNIMVNSTLPELQIH